MKEQQRLGQRMEHAGRLVRRAEERRVTAVLARIGPHTRRVGTIGFTYPKASYPLPPNPELSGEKGEEVLRRAASELAPAVQSLRDYNAFLAQRGVSRGLLWRGWR